MATTSNPEAIVGRRRRRRGPVVLAALATVAVVIAAIAVVVWWKRGESVDTARSHWQPPVQEPLASSMQVRPVPGWRVTVTDIGLPQADSSGQSVFTDGRGPNLARPLVGTLGDRAYFLASRAAGHDAGQWWLTGLDVSRGKPVFEPVALNSGPWPPECVLNGPTVVLCVSSDGHSRQAWVIDARTGVVSFNGPTALTIPPDYTLAVQQVGIYAIAEAQHEDEHQGVYGIGPKGVTTWFVPGSGKVDEPSTSGPPPTSGADAALKLASQTVAGRGADRQVVFSLVDGSVITPQLPANAELQGTMFYPEGFAAEVLIGQDRRVEFFDNAGGRIGRHIPGELALHSDSLGIPIVNLHGRWAAYAPDGRTLLEVTGSSPYRAVLIGNQLFVDQSGGNPAFASWQPYNLKTGAAGKACELNLGLFLGFHGGVAVLGGADSTWGVDLATCQTLWTLPAGDSFGTVWRINNTLVQLSDDATELHSLVAPG